jgi:large subunit ribosomal protein L18
MDKNTSKRLHRISRHARSKAKAIGSAKRPRVSVFKSNNYLSAQFIDDAKISKTLISGSTAEKGFKGTKIEAAEALGQKLGKAAVEKGITEIIFDKSGFKYHGRVKSFAEGLRKSGVKF